MYTHSSARFQSIRGYELFYQMWTAPRVDPERTIIIHHGLGEHSGRYRHVLDAFLDDQVSFIAYDAYGHGQSQGRKGDSIDVNHFILDLEDFLLHIRQEYQIKRPILLGHSMGGLIALAFALRFSNQWALKALVCSGPALRPVLNRLQSLKLESGKILDLIAPALTLPSGLPAEGLSHDRSEVDAYTNDPLVHDQISARMANGLVQKGQSVLKRAHLLKIPFCLMHGGSDPIADPEASAEFAHDCASKDMELKIYPNLYHEIFNESPPDRNRVLQDLRTWVLNRI
ncbi:MAG: lysophospholipase [Leptospiraceae bacterium]|nr:lysophospholipase [Leptospiraceae bacterium]